jgi:large subunit ribosomal protein L22
MQSKATLKGARVSAQKARLVANLVRGLPAGEAVEKLAFLNKKSAPVIRKLIESLANAEVSAERSSTALDVDSLLVATITVNEGPSLRRFRPRAQGRATRILKKTSHITVVLAVA